MFSTLLQISENNPVLEKSTKFVKHIYWKMLNALIDILNFQYTA